MRRIVGGCKRYGEQCMDPSLELVITFEEGALSLSEPKWLW